MAHEGAPGVIAHEGTIDLRDCLVEVTTHDDDLAPVAGHIGQLRLQLSETRQVVLLQQELRDKGGVLHLL